MVRMLGLGTIAKLLVDISADTTGIERSLGSAEARVKSFAASVEKKIDTRAFLAVGAAITGVGVGLVGLLVHTGLFAARVEVLETVMKTVGKTAGISAETLAEQEEVIKKLGITTKSAREILILFMQSQLDVADAAKIARVAQDLAVISGQNSSDAAVTLTNAIVAQRPELLKQYGIVKTIDDIYLKYGKDLKIVTEKVDKSGKTTRSWSRDLTEAEKKQAFLNEILEEGKKVAGVYEEAMGDVGKKLTSLPRLIEDAKDAFGKAFIPIIGKAVDILSELLKRFTDLSPETKTMITHIVMFAAGLALVVGPILTLIGLLPTLIAGFGVLLGPVGLVTGAVTALVATIGILVWKHWDEIKAKVTETVKAIIEKFGGWETIMGRVRNFIENTVRPTVEKITGKVNELGKKFAEVGKKISEKFIAIEPDLIDAIDNMKEAIKKFGEKAGPIIEKGIEFLELLAKAAIDSIPKIVDKIGDLVGWLAKLDPRWIEIMLGVIGFVVVLTTLSVAIGKVLGLFKILSLPLVKIGTVIGGIIVFIKTFGAAIVGAFETLYIVFLGIPEPITKIILAIIALIAVGILIWKNWDKIKAKAIQIWGAIRNFLVNLWVTIGEKAIGIWNSIKEFFVNLWGGIKETIITNWDSIVEWFGEMWERVKEVFKKKGEDIWAWMRDWIPFLNIIVENWDEIIAKLKEGWDKILGFFIEKGTAIKEFLDETWESIKEKTIEVWDSIKEFFGDIWESIKEKAIEIWEAIKEFLINIFDPIKEKAIEIWTSIKDFFIETWESIKANIIETWNSIKDFFVETWNSIITAINTFKENFLKVWDKIKEGLKRPINAMIRLINSFFSRIQSGMNNMISALNRIGFKVPSWLGKIIPGLAGREFSISISKISIPRIPQLQLGGYITEPGFVDVGERGRERVFLPGGAKVVPLEGTQTQKVVKYVIGNVTIANNLMKSEEFIKKIAREVSAIQGKEVTM